MITFNNRLFPILLFLYSLSVPAQTQDTFEQRAERHIDDVADIFGFNAGYKQVFAIASANFYQYKRTGQTAFLDKALQLVKIGHDAIDEMNSWADPELDISFGLWMGMDCYLRWSDDYYTPELKDAAKFTFTQCEHYNNHGTSNKQLMASSARLMASFEWPDATFASGYDKGDSASTGGFRFQQACQKYVQRGEDEFNSPTYYAFHYGPMRTVADFAPNTPITLIENGKSYNFKKIASLTAEWMLASSATEWMQGHWVGATARLTINQSRPQHQYVMGDLVMRLYFGGLYGGDKDGNFEKFRSYGSVVAAVSDYRAPELLQNIANRTLAEGYTAYERKLLEFGRYKVNYYLTNFRMPEYGVFSSYEVGESVDNDPRFTFGTQNIRWGVYWKDPTSNDSGFVLKHELDPSDPLQPGLSQYEHVSQNKGTLVGVYNIPANDAVPEIKGYTPSSYDAFIDNSGTGQVYLKYNNMLMGVHLSQPFNWNEGDMTFLSKATQLGFVVETAKASTYPGTDEQKLAAFKQAVQPNFTAGRFSLDADNVPAMEYTSLNGTTIETKYRTYTKINGTPIEYTKRKLIDNPWMQQEYDGTDLRVDYNGDYKTYDFREWTAFTTAIDETDVGVELEAENYDTRNTKSDPPTALWEVDTLEKDFQATGYVVVKNASGSSTVGYEISNRLSYNFYIRNGGTYHIWVRRFAKDDADNSAFFAIDKTIFNSTDNSGVFNEWVWKKVNTQMLDKGTHTLDLVLREDGYLVDAFLITLSDEDPNDKGNDDVDPALNDEIVTVPFSKDIPVLPAPGEADNKGWTLFPNPVEDSFVLSIENFSNYRGANFMVLGTDSKVLLSGTVENPKQNIIVGNLATGIYFVRITDSTGNSFRKFIKN